MEKGWRTYIDADWIATYIAIYNLYCMLFNWIVQHLGSSWADGNKAPGPSCYLSTCNVWCLLSSFIWSNPSCLSLPTCTPPLVSLPYSPRLRLLKTRSRGFRENISRLFNFPLAFTSGPAIPLSRLFLSRSFSCPSESLFLPSRCIETIYIMKQFFWRWGSKRQRRERLQTRCVSYLWTLLLLSIKAWRRNESESPIWWLFHPPCCSISNINNHFELFTRSRSALCRLERAVRNLCVCALTLDSESSFCGAFMCFMYVYIYVWYKTTSKIFL